MLGRMKNWEEENKAIRSRLQVVKPDPEFGFGNQNRTMTRLQPDQNRKANLR